MDSSSGSFLMRVSLASARNRSAGHLNQIFLEKELRRPASVLMVAFHYPPESSSGMLRTRSFSRYLHEFGWKPHILTCSKSVYETVDPSLMAPDGVSVVRARAFDSKRLLGIRGRYPAALAVPDRYWTWLPGAVLKGRKLIRREKIDVLYSTSPVQTAHLIAMALRSLTGIPWIADFRDPWSTVSGQAGRPLVWFDKFLERRVMETADLVIANTRRMRARFGERFPKVPKERLTYIYNGFDEADFRDLSSPSHSQNDRFEITHSGTIYPAFRDPQPLLEAMSVVLEDELIPREKVRLNLVGGGAHVESSEFKQRLAALRLTDNVRIVARVPHAESLALLMRSDALLLLQYTAGLETQLPAKVFEYLRAGKPMLAIVSPGETADFIARHKLGYSVDYRDLSGLVSALLSLYADRAKATSRQVAPELLEQFSRRALAGELAVLLDEQRARSRRASTR